MKLPRLVRLVRVNKFHELTGYTEKAVYEKMRTGAWVEGRHVQRAPDGHILVDLEEFEKWVEGEAA